MEQDLEEVERKDLLFNIGYALWQADRKKVDIDVCRERAERVLGHLKLSGIRFYRPRPTLQNYFPKTGAPGRDDD